LRKVAKCGIEKYDRLPAVYGIIDVDAMRAGLAKLLKKRDKIEKKIKEIEKQLDGVAAMIKTIMEK